MIDSEFTNAFIDSGTLISTSKGRVLVGWGERRWMSAPPEKVDCPVFYFPDFFFKEKHAWFQHAHTIELDVSELLTELIPLLKEPRRSFEWKNLYQNLFQTTFDELQVKFAKKELAKAVPFVFELTEQHMTPSQLVCSLLNVLNYISTNPAYVYGFWDHSQGILGATPEMLFAFTREQDPRLETVACAATKASSADILSLMQDPKELHEHQLVVQGIVESLSPFGSVDVGMIKLLQLPRLAHLLTPILVKLNRTPQYEEVVKALHPTPALGAFPRNKGNEWLNDYQNKIDRKRFGAPVGYLHKNIYESNCYVAIRNVQWGHQQIFLGAGCGIVPQSQLAHEWAEINLKIQAVKEILAL